MSVAIKVDGVSPPLPVSGVKLAPISKDDTWEPYRRHSDEFVYKPKVSKQRPIFPVKSFTIGGEGLKRTNKWAADLKNMYPDGEDELVHQHLDNFLEAFQSGVEIPTPKNRFALLAVDGFLISIQCLKEHGVKFD